MKINMINKILIVILMILIVSEFISVGTVKGVSMQPTLHEGDITIILKHITPHDGDIVVIDTAKIPAYKQEAPYIIKRYYADKSTDGYYVLGDNANSSYDSRYFGEVPKNSLDSVVLFHFKIYRLTDIMKFFKNISKVI